jgi:hypothetical protein
MQTRNVFWLKIAVLLIPALSVSAASDDFWYELFYGNKKIGYLHITFSETIENGKEIRKTRSRTRIKFKPLIDLDVVEHTHSNTRGVYSISRYGLVNGDSVFLEGALDRNQFTIETRHKGQSERKTVMTNQYDYTGSDTPVLALSSKGDERSLRILQFENFEVITRSFKWVDTETLNINGEDIPCRVIEIQSPNASAKRWVTDDQYCYLVREEGSAKTGKYSVLLSDKESALDF